MTKREYMKVIGFSVYNPDFNPDEEIDENFIRLVECLRNLAFLTSRVKRWDTNGLSDDTFMEEIPWK